MGNFVIVKAGTGLLSRIESKVSIDRFRWSDYLAGLVAGKQTSGEEFLREAQAAGKPFEEAAAELIQKLREAENAAGNLLGNAREQIYERGFLQHQLSQADHMLAGVRKGLFERGTMMPWEVVATVGDGAHPERIAAGESFCEILRRKIQRTQGAEAIAEEAQTELARLAEVSKALL